MRKFYPAQKMDFIFSGLRRLICHLFSGPELIKIKSQKVQSFYLMIFTMLLSGNITVKSQTTLSAGDILITSFDATKTVTDDKFSFVTLKDLQPNTVIYFTDRGYFGNNTWQSANGGTEGSISWSLGSDNVAAGTEVVIQSLSAKVNNVAKGSVASIAGSNANGLSLSSPSGDQIIAFQGGGGNPAASGVTMIGGFHWNYCPIDYYSVYTTDASWDNIGVNSTCSAGPNSSAMPPGLNASSAFWVGFFKPTPPAQNIQNYTKGQFNGAGAPFSSLAALKSAILNRNNWTALKYDDPTVVNVPTGYTFYSACTAPAITSQPSASTICAGVNTTFTVAANNATGYQWQVNQGAGFVNISNNAQYSGATSSTLTIIGATAAFNGYVYRVVASGTCTPVAVSNGATLTVNSSPSVTSQPSSSTICAGSNTTFSAVFSNATGYQWQVDQGAGFNNISNNATYSGSTTSTLTITGATATLNGYVYRVVASGACTPAAVSNGAALTVNSSPAITFQPSSSTICSGSNVSFTATASNATGYQWQVDQGAGFINISNGAPYSGATTATLTITGATAGLNGYLYRAVATGSCSPAATSNSAALTVNSAPAITSQPSSSTICSGSNASFTAAANNATGYQWQVNQGAGFINISNGAPYSGATTATLTITGATAALNGYAYRVVATGSCSPTATSNSATLTVNSAPAITSQPSASIICAGSNTTFSAVFSSATGYQWQVNQGAGFINISNNAQYSGATSSTLTITGATAAFNGYVYRVVASGTCTPATVSNGATLTVNSSPSLTSQPSSSTICAGSNTTFSAVFSNATGYQWQVDQGAGFINISNGAPYSGATTVTLNITGATAALNGYAYRVVATGVCSPTATSNSATLTVNSAPAITSQPSSSTICSGSNASFTAAANNATGYQWQVDQGAGFINIISGAPYSGATTATLTITGATAGLNGYLYRVVATGVCSPTATSNSATLTVNSAPAITSQPSSSTICSGSNVSFTATASNATGYQWQVDQGTGYTSISNNATYSGATTATLTITGATAALNGYVYRFVALGACTPAAVSNGAALTVSSVSGSATKNNVTCNGGSNGSITLTPSGGNAPYTYNWGGGIVTKDRTGLTAGTYTVTIKDSNGCTGNVSITITEPTVLVATAGAQTNVSCNGSATGSATVNVTGGTGLYTYSWSPNGGTAATANGLAAGTYLVTVTDANGCQTTQSFTITQAEVVNAPTGVTTQTFNSGDMLSVLVVSGQGIKWYATAADATDHINALPMTTLIVNNKTYYATQTIGGCESKTSLAVLAYNDTLGVNNASSNIKLQIYPNPVNDVLYFNGEEKISKIVIMSIDGKKVSEKKMSNERKLNVHTLIQGTYLINIFTDKGVQTIKFIKK